MPAFMEEYEKIEKPSVGIPNFVMNQPYVPTNGLADVGLELEIEGENLPSAGKLAKVVGKTSSASWLTKADGSLRGEALEYVLATPCKIDEVDVLVEGLYDSFKTNNTNLLLTNRCSTHVHVNMGGKKVNEITSALALWTAFEEPLTLWAGEERVNNHFCLGSKDCNAGTIAAWRSFLRTGRADFNENLKYSSLNILTLYRFGSLEYRVMNASEDSQRIVDWTKFVYELTRYAGDTFANPATMSYSMSERGGRELFLEICEKANVSPSFVTGVMDTVQDMNSTVLNGFRRAQPLIGGFPWHEWYEECTKPYVEDPFGKKSKKKQTFDATMLDFDVDLRDGAIDPRIERIWATAPAVPAAPPAPDARPAYVPDHFVMRRGAWVNPNFSIARHRETLVGQDNVPYNPYQTGPRGLAIERLSLKGEMLSFYGNNAMRVAKAIIVSISVDGNRVQIVADQNLVMGNRNYGATPYWYDCATGYWDGDSTLGFIH